MIKSNTTNAITYFIQNFDFGTKFCPLTKFLKYTVNFNKVMILIQGVFNQLQTINCFCDFTCPSVLLFLLLKNSCITYYCSPTKLWQGSVLSHVCLSFCSQGRGVGLYRALAPAPLYRWVTVYLCTNPDPSQTCSNSFTMYPILSASGLLAFY